MDARILCLRISLLGEGKVLIKKANEISASVDKKSFLFIRSILFCKFEISLNTLQPFVWRPSDIWRTTPESMLNKLLKAFPSLPHTYLFLSISSVLFSK